MTDILTDHMKKAKAFSGLFHDYNTQDIATKQAATKELALGMISESMQVMDVLNWKSHHLDLHPVSRSKLIEECVDVYKYMLSILALWDVTSEEFAHEFNRKDLVNWSRYQSETALKSLANSTNPIAALDLDGTLCAYPENIIDFMNVCFNKNIKIADLKDLHAVEDAYRDLAGVSPKDYRLAKQDFIDQGWYSRHSPPLPGAVQFTHDLKSLGFTIVLLSARPYKEHNRIFADTVEWCQANNVAFDIIYWEKNKDMRILKSFPNLSFLLDDDEFIINEVARLGYRAFLFKRPYNGHDVSSNVLQSGAQIVLSYDEVLEQLVETREA